MFYRRCPCDHRLGKSLKDREFKIIMKFVNYFRYSRFKLQ